MWFQSTQRYVYISYPSCCGRYSRRHRNGWYIHIGRRLVEVWLSRLCNGNVMNSVNWLLIITRRLTLIIKTTYHRRSNWTAPPAGTARICDDTRRSDPTSRADHCSSSDKRRRVSSECEAPPLSDCWNICRISSAALRVEGLRRFMQILHRLLQKYSKVSHTCLYAVWPISGMMMPLISMHTCLTQNIRTGVVLCFDFLYRSCIHSNQSLF